ncbi:putative virion structural protein [Ralstonia phage RP31]|uniref:Putative virion structural protein n=2 Tax=Ripduovirus RP12 TaxID=2560700 RepID=A0A1L7N170_9CAUD|nr:putative virion structural protein [Ralstonia phage RP12]BAW19220.1 putative virion structural protein [Ralstonia phage RP12]BAW19506.1 putative virion structural protein [Ralstonia phage RP31]
MSTLTDLKANIDSFRYNPTKIQGAVLRMVRDVSAGKLDIVDPSNPFVFLVEASATVGASIMTESATNNRKQYAQVAQTVQDLYRHMHYGDFNDIFALPSKAGFVMGFNKDELIARMVQMPDGDIRKIVIPRNTTVSIAGTLFSLQYPIEVRQLAHGGLQVVYDTSKTTPLKNIDTNVIEWQSMRQADGSEMILFPVILDQFNIITQSDVVNGAQKFSLSTTISDQFYFCRVWQETTNGWVELPTTYSQDIYSNNGPVAIVKVVDQQVTVEIPIVFVKTGQISGKVRMDVYQTKGPISQDLGGFDPKQFTINWLAIDKNEQDQYVSPLKAMTTAVVYSSAMTTGGRNAMTFDELKDRVIQNAFGPTILPITPAQAQKKLERNGYNIVKNLDHVTDRIFAATRPMPDPKDVELITPASAGIHTLTETMEHLGMLSTSYVNNQSLTLGPKTLYRVDQGVLKVVSDSEVALLNSLPGDKKAVVITEGSYFYSPFHYVFDATSSTFVSRSYYLDSPKINARSFIAENGTTSLQVSTSSAQIARTPSGWQLTVTTNSSQEWKDLDDEKTHITLAYQPDRSGDYAYTLGTLLGKTTAGERVYQFDIKTSYDIDANNAMQLTNFMMYEQSQQFLRTPLEQNFELFYSVSSPMPSTWTATTFDPLIGTFLLPFGSVGVSRERLDVILGYSLSNLWTRGRTVVGEQDYAKWEVDVQATYEKDVYQADPVTGAAFTVVNGVLTYNKLHSAGDLVFTGPNNDVPVIKYAKGSIKKDAYGNPIVVGGRKLMRQIDLFLLEAPYYFATNKAATDYRTQLVDTIVQWIADDLKDISKMLLDKTNIYFYPVQNVGSVDVIYGAGLKSTIDAGQYFNLKLYVKDSVYKNDKLRESLSRSSVVSISECLKSKTVSNSQIVDALKITYGSDVVAFDLEGLGGTAQLSIVTMVDDSARLTLRKKLEYRPDQTFALREDVNIEFVAAERAGVTLDA